jgi:DNA polymerase II small subunit
MINNIPGMQIDKPIEVMINMLKARHLAPMWGSKTPLATEPEDHLVIDPIPDIFHGGHVHINGYGKYKGVQIVNSGTMQAQTSFQKSLNIDPTPGQVTLLNLKTRIPSQLDFM